MSELVQYSQNDLLAMLKGVNIIPNDCPKPMVDMFFEMCKSTGLNPLNRHAYIIPRNEKQKDGSYKVKYSMQVSIDGFRSIAEKTGQYIGSSEALFDNGLTEFECAVANKQLHPNTAKITVKKLINGVVGEFTATASWESYAVCYNGKPSGLWQKFPYLMLSKCAEALALRKAFPSVLGGLYTSDEMQQAKPIDIPEQKPSAKLVNWALNNGLTTEDIKEQKEKLFPDVMLLNQLQCDTIQAHLEEKILEIKALEVA